MKKAFRYDPWTQEIISIKGRATYSIAEILPKEYIKSFFRKKGFKGPRVWRKNQPLNRYTEYPGIPQEEWGEKFKPTIKLPKNKTQSDFYHAPTILNNVNDQIPLLELSQSCT